MTLKKTASALIFFLFTCVILQAKDYYVKWGGTGNGSKWETAMGQAQFTRALNHLNNEEDDVVFHVAEGEYFPVYDYKLGTPEEQSKYTFLVTGNVTIIGGYPKDADDGAVADPRKYKTIFTSDFDNDNVVTSDPESGILYAENMSNDALDIFILAQSQDDIYFSDGKYSVKNSLQDNGKQKYFNLNGVYIKGGANSSIRVCNPSIHVSIENTSFYDSYLAILTNESNITNTKYEISNSDLYHCNGAFSILEAESIELSNVKISECGASYYTTHTGRGVLHFDGLEYTNNIGGIFIDNESQTCPSQLFIENSKFENNFTDNNADKCLIQTYLGELVAKNCLFKKNNWIATIQQAHVYLENCEFIENVANSKDDKILLVEGPLDNSYLRENYTPTLTGTKIKDCTFKSNNCYRLCLMPYIDNIYSADTITGCTFEDNIVTDVMIYGSLDSDITFENTTITNNEVGSLIDYPHNLYINSTLFEGNKTKEFESISPQNLYVNNSIFKNNECDSIFFNVDSTAKFVNSTIENNSAKKLVYGFSQKLDVENCLFEENVSNLFYHKNVEQDNAIQLSFKNTDFISNQTLDNEVAMELSMNTGDKIDFSRVNFIGNSAKYILNDKNGNTNISKCDFFNNNVVGLLTLSNMTSTVEASSFRLNKMSNGHLIYSPDVNLTLKNNTIVSNEANGGLFSVYPSAAQVYLYNNTIISNGDYASSLVGGSLLDHAMIGNVIGEKLSNRFKENNISNNLFLKTEDVSIPDDILSNNIFTDDFSILFDGTYNSSTGLFTPELEMNEDFTPVVALKTDKLSDGTSLRFPLSETTVTTDQRGVKRLNSTSMGAYETGCPSDTILVNDTINVGEKFFEKVYTTAGSYSIFENLQNEVGCDSVVMHTLIVMPDPTRTEYYVKTNGTGDGSSWENAMDGRDFEQIIPLVPGGTTFYIAEGVYAPKGTLIKGGGGGGGRPLGFVTNTRVNIIGGFPDDAGLGATPNPKLYKTIFNGDIKGDDEVVYLKNVCGIDSVVIRNTEDNLYHVIHISSAARDQSVKSINIQGITVKGGYYSGISYCTNYDVKVTFEKCTLTQCQRAIDCWPSDFDVKECTFTDNQIGVASYNDLSRNITIEKSTFNRNNTAVSGVYHTTISNSTFANCCRGISMFIRNNSSDVLDLKNNTFINVGDGVLLRMPYIYEGDDITGSFNMFAIGNIIDSKCTSVKITDANESDGLPTSYLMSYNVLAQSQINETIKPHIGDNNIILEDINSLHGIMDGTLKNDAFVPNLIDNGGFTPTIALKADKLPDGTSIRFPLSETAVTDDQRGVERLDPTCMGAYEMACDPDTTLANDTINVGEKFLDKVYTTVGRHDSIFETIPGEAGCNNVVMHTLIVKPDPTKFNYYVKTERHGTGDGSSWENAMDSIDFATYLPLAPDGATFYVAEGTYKPVYGTDLKKPDITSNLCYTINSDVTIRGGYPADAKEEVESDPKRYKTIFDGDIIGDDVIDETLGEDGFPLLERINDKDNVSRIFNVGNYGKTHVNNITIDGIVCQNARSLLHNSTGVSLNILNTNINRIIGYEIAAGSLGDINMRNSVLSKNKPTVIAHSVGNKFSIVNTTIENNRFFNNFAIFLTDKDILVNLNGVSILNNMFTNQLFEGGNVDVTISNSHFIGNQTNANAFVFGVKHIDSHNNVFEKNMNKYGLYSALGNISLRKDSFISNSIGYIANSTNGDWVSVDSSAFIDNYAKNIVGTANGNVSVSSSTFIDNELDVNATTFTVYGYEAIYSLVYGKNATVVDSRFEGNRRISIPPVAAIYADGVCVAKRDTFENNNLARAFKLKEAKIDSCIVRDNQLQFVYFEPDLDYTRVLDCDSITNSIFERNLGTRTANGDSTLFSTYSNNFVAYKNIIRENAAIGILALNVSNNIKISECLYENNYSRDRFLHWCCDGNFSLYNNTIVSNKTERDLILNSCAGKGTPEVYNNTIIGNDVKGSIFSNTQFNAFVGNIIFGNTHKKDNTIGLTSADVFRYNITPMYNMGEGFIAPDNTNIVSDYYVNLDDLSDVKDRSEEIATLFEGTYDKSSGLFTL